MISPISSSLAPTTQALASQKPAPAPATAQSSSVPQDTVSLSSQATHAPAIRHDGDGDGH
ncbi:MAG: hypothetical protein ACLGSH_09450 [Acidobacteriota bacterium]